MKKILILCSVLLTSGCATQSDGTMVANPGSITTAMGDALTRFVPALKPRITAAQLLGKDADWVRLKLGEPSFARADLQANIWQYKNTTCILNLFLYAQSDQNPALSLLHFDARDAQGRGTDRDACLSTFQN